LSTTINVTTQKKRDDRFRYGIGFDYEKAKYMLYGNAYAAFITDGIFQEALAPGFDVINPKDDTEVDWNDEFWDKLEPMWNDFLPIGKYERTYGKALLSVMQNTLDKDELIVRVFEPKNYEPYYDKTGKIAYVEATEYIGGTIAEEIKHKLGNKPVKDSNIGSMPPSTLPNKSNGKQADLDWVHEVIIRTKDKIGEGASYIEPVFDTLYGLQTVSANSVYFAIRVGGGLKVIKIPEAKLGDTAYMTRVEDMLKSIDSAMSTITIPIVSGLGTEQPDFELKSGDQIDFKTIKDELRADLSAYSKLPREALIGSELGLRSAETNQGAYFRVLEDIQRQYVPTLLWLVKRFAEKYGWNAEKIGIQFRKRLEINETEQIGVLEKKAIILEKLLAQNVTFDSAIELLDLEELEQEEEEPEDQNVPTTPEMIQEDATIEGPREEEPIIAK
jgi:hypothetical protein